MKTLPPIKKFLSFQKRLVIQKTEDIFLYQWHISFKKENRMKIIDAHNHPDWLGHNLDRFLKNMETNGIEKTWLLSWESPRYESDKNIEKFISGPIFGGSNVSLPFSRCLAYAERAPEKFILGYCPDPRNPYACDQLRAAHSIYGVKVCGECKFRTMYNSPDCLRLFRTAGELGMPVTLHFDYDFQIHSDDPRGEWWGGTIDTLEDMLKKCPETIFLGHAPGFWLHIADDGLWEKVRYPQAEGNPVLKEGRIQELLRKHPNLYCDISAGSGRSALKRDIPHAIRFLTEFQDRIVYARDCFDNGHQEFLNSLSLPESILEKIYYKNAESLLKKGE